MLWLKGKWEKCYESVNELCLHTPRQWEHISCIIFQNEFQLYFVLILQQKLYFEGKKFISTNISKTYFNPYISRWNLKVLCSSGWPLSGLWPQVMINRIMPVPSVRAMTDRCSKPYTLGRMQAQRYKSFWIRCHGWESDLGPQGFGSITLPHSL